LCSTRKASAFIDETASFAEGLCAERFADSPVKRKPKVEGDDA